MAKVPVKNTFTKAIRIGHDVIQRKQVMSIEETLLYSPRVQRLKESGKLDFPYYPLEKAQTEGQNQNPASGVGGEVVEVVEVVEEDNLKVLPHIGDSRAAKLESVGIESFADLASMDAGVLDGLLEITHSQAEEIIAAAKELLGG